MENKIKSTTTKRIMHGTLWVVLLGYSACLLFWMFWGFGRSTLTHTQFRYSLVPLRTILSYIHQLKPSYFLIPIINLAGNVGVFVPFGVLLPLLIRSCRSFRRFSLVFLCAIVSLELLQTVLRVGTSDIDDVLLNYLGAAVGFGLVQIIKSRNK
ncbi:VanZ family protein [Paenibacillus cremeus]|uniref:VanZ family protein n=1 Tax=Paenibacillus cremeus TaxID=2163881 RepID=A0A559KFA6_9BACL|nr:VanZ family protein [Paenibacillus cremeus]TVY10814.1 VanZ family protein [Paenibacillus cremeus]